MTNEEKAAQKVAKQEAKADASAKEKLEAKEKAEAEARLEAETDVFEEAERLGIPIPKTSMTGFKGKKPSEIEKEEIRLKKHVVGILKIAIAKQKADAKLKPIDRRRAYLASRFKAVKSRTRAHTYSDANIKAWLEEYNIIINTPKRWNKITNNGKVNFTPGNKKKQTARDVLDGMNLDDEE